MKGEEKEAAQLARQKASWVMSISLSTNTALDCTITSTNEEVFERSTNSNTVLKQGTSNLAS